MKMFQIWSVGIILVITRATITIHIYILHP